jgi:hypothetical protein
MRVLCALDDWWACRSGQSNLIKEVSPLGRGGLCDWMTKHNSTPIRLLILVCLPFSQAGQGRRLLIYEYCYDTCLLHLLTTVFFTCSTNLSTSLLTIIFHYCFLYLTLTRSQYFCPGRYIRTLDCCLLRRNNLVVLRILEKSLV